MGTVAGKGDELARDEHGAGHHPVWQMIPAGNVGIVHKEGVTLIDVVTEGL